MRPPIPRKEPNQSILSDSVTGFPAGRTRARLPNTIHPRRALMLIRLEDHFARCVFAYIKMNNHFQGVSSAKRPAEKAPNQPPIGGPASKRPRLKFLFLPGGNVVPISATALGTSMALPIPDKPLIKLNAMKLLQKALTKEHRTHQPAPARTIFLWPQIVPRRPVIRMNVP